MNGKKNGAKKPGVYSAYIYLALSICIVTALTIGILTMSYNYGGEVYSAVSLPPISVPDISLPNQSGEPVDNDQSDVDAIVEEPDPVYALPVAEGVITKGFSMDTLVYSETMKDYRVHTGVSISGELGAAVRAYADGTIAEITDDPFYGKSIAIVHADNVTTYYKNLALELPDTVKTGAVVKAGDIIGAVGNTAIIEIMDEAHLHFEMRVNGRLVDPAASLEDLT